MFEREKARKYLESIGMVSSRNGEAVEKLISAMDVQSGQGAYRNSNRYTGSREYGLVERIAWSANCSKNLVNRFLFKALERFKEKYDANDPKFASICNRNTLDVLTPLQFLYLITADYSSKCI